MAERFFQTPADQHAGGRRDDPEQEWNAPAPFQHGLLAERHVGQRRDERAEREPQSGCCEVPAREKSTGVVGRIFDEQGRARAEFATGRETLQQACGEHDHRRGHAGHRVSRRARVQRAAERHQHDGEDHRLLAAGAVGIRVDHDAAKRTHDKTDAEDADRQQELVRRRCGRKEQLADLDRKEAVDGEVVELERRADGRRGDDVRLREACLVQCEC